ncbi:MAG: hypothetical protein CBARDMAM_4510 [uncultured Caballeronia sp.]|nr:MAG: hypothetical protein CBARDMAM_4510 [uncultured Caballeronia sp.]
MQQIFGWIKDGRVRPHVTKRYALEQTTAALNNMASMVSTSNEDRFSLQDQVTDPACRVL